MRGIAMNKFKAYCVALVLIFGMVYGEQTSLGGEVVIGKRYFSPNQKIHFIMQQDGNLVVYENTKPLWNSGTEKHYYATLHLQQNDGNLVIMYTKVPFGGTPSIIWSSETSTDKSGNKITASYQDFYLAITDDGKLQIRAKKIASGEDTLLWANAHRPCAIYSTCTVPAS